MNMAVKLISSSFTSLSFIGLELYGAVNVVAFELLDDWFVFISYLLSKRGLNKAFCGEDINLFSLIVNNYLQTIIYYIFLVFR